MNIQIKSTKVTKGIHIIFNNWSLFVVIANETGKACKGDEVYHLSKRGYWFSALQQDHV